MKKKIILSIFFCCATTLVTSKQNFKSAFAMDNRALTKNVIRTPITTLPTGELAKKIAYTTTYIVESYVNIIDI